MDKELLLPAEREKFRSQCRTSLKALIGDLEHRLPHAGSHEAPTLYHQLVKYREALAAFHGATPPSPVLIP